MTSPFDRTDPAGVKGWLLVFCLFLLAWQPVSLALRAASVLDALPLRGLPLALLVAARVLVTSFGIAAGIAIVRRAAGALAMARTSLALSAATDVIAYATPYWPNNGPPDEASLVIVLALIHYTAWMTYLLRSRRVRHTLK